ncbi:MAG: DUF2514 domain-containing protein [Zoogloeaceae bacterium]|nr:DUF2514 domain-containing protein [Zoogloeaceae bacterium]
MNPAILKIGAVAASLVFLLVTAYRIGGSAARADLEAYRATVAMESQKAESEARETEQLRAQAAQKAIDDAYQERDKVRADASNARAAADRLRKQLALLTNQATGDTGTVGSVEGIENQSSISLLAELLDRHSRELVAVGEYADQLRVAGTSCERQYDAVSGQ